MALPKIIDTVSALIESTEDRYRKFSQGEGDKYLLFVNTTALAGVGISNKDRYACIANIVFNSFNPDEQDFILQNHELPASVLQNIGKQIKTPEVVAPAPLFNFVAPDLDSMKVWAINAVDIAAERSRQAFLTPGDGQSYVYREKLVEARNIVDGRTDATPLIDAEVGITADNKQDIAKLIIDSGLKAVEQLADIEKIRLSAKKEIRASDNTDDIREIVSNLNFGGRGPTSIGANASAVPASTPTATPAAAPADAQTAP